MNYVYWYLGVGVAVMLVLVGQHLMTRGQESKSLHQFLDEARPEKKKITYRILVNGIIPVLAVIVMVVIWPGLLCMQAMMLIKGKERENPGTSEFSVEREDLGEKMSLAEIESREIVVDPLNAVPALPFGHLNRAWREFTSRQPEDSELWSFSSRWRGPSGQEELRSGYVVVQGRKPASYFLTVAKPIQARG